MISQMASIYIYIYIYIDIKKDTIRQVSPEPRVRRVMKEDVREASARPTLKWSAIVGRRRPKESLKKKVRIVFHLGSKS